MDADETHGIRGDELAQDADGADLDAAPQHLGEAGVRGDGLADGAQAIAEDEAGDDEGLAEGSVRGESGLAGDG
jgi:hypothetical protein